MATSRLDWLLNGFLQRATDVRHAVAVSGDGLLVASSPELAPERAEQFAAMVAGTVSLAHSVSRCVDGDVVLRTIVQMRRGLLIVVAIGDGATLASLAVVGQPGCDIGRIAAEMASLVEQVGSTLTPSVRAG
jgi:predicted regulator of Ras-like GTPase activity (Roadblock/LC7/MglB family)